MHRVTRKNIPPLEQERIRASFLKLFPEAYSKNEQSCKYTLRVDNPLSILKQYTNGTLYIESALASVVDRFQETVGTTTANAEKHFVRKEAGSWIGTDECGKGDYFGPLVVAGVWLEAETTAYLQSKGVRDSKDLGDGQILILARVIRERCAGQFAIDVCMPEEYNRVLSQPVYKNNSARLLGSMHAEVISQLLAAHECEDIVIDKFGQEQHVLDFLEPQYKLKHFLFRHKAESNIAVAAASILAREAFLKGMDELSGRVGVELPKGASLEMEKTAAEIVADQGEEILNTIAKLHFKTTQRVLQAARNL